MAGEDFDRKFCEGREEGLEPAHTGNVIRIDAVGNGSSPLAAYLHLVNRKYIVILAQSIPVRAQHLPMGFRICMFILLTSAVFFCLTSVTPAGVLPEQYWYQSRRLCHTRFTSSDTPCFIS